MPIEKAWNTATEERIKNEVPEKPGVYELGSSDQLLYIGKTDNLRQRLLEHIQNNGPDRFRYKAAGVLQDPTRIEKKHINKYQMKHGRLPSWNESSGMPADIKQRLIGQRPENSQKTLEQIWKKQQEQMEQTFRWRRRTWIWRFTTFLLSIVSFVAGNLI